MMDSGVAGLAMVNVGDVTFCMVAEWVRRRTRGRANSLRDTCERKGRKGRKRSL